MRKFSAAVLWIVAMLSWSSASPSGGPIKSYWANFVDFATIHDLAPGDGGDSVPPEYAGCPFSPPNVVFSVNFTSGMTYIDNVLYGIEWENGSGPNIFLYTMADSFCATGTRVGLSPVGFTNLESLAYCSADGFLYSVDFDFPAHTGRLIRIDPATGTGTVIGAPMAFDVRILGMTCDAAGTLWAVSAGHGGRVTEIYTVNRNTGVETLVGATGTASQSLEALELDTSGASPRLLAAGATLYEIDTGSGSASLVGGSYDTVWAMAQIRKEQDTDSDGDGIGDSVDNCTNVFNAGQADADGDGHGNICDADFDNSCGAVNFIDLSIMQSVFFTISPEQDLDNTGGPVNFADLAIMQGLFFLPPGPSADGICN